MRVARSLVAAAELTVSLTRWICGPAALYLAIIALSGTAVSCASLAAIAARRQEPTPQKPMVACAISCDYMGWSFRTQHKCRNRRRFDSIFITGQEDVPGDPSRSRWLTGLTSWGAEQVTRERLKAEGADPANALAWSRRYSEILKDVQREFGAAAKESYLKIDVVLTSCDSYIDSYCDTPGVECGNRSRGFEVP